MKKNYALTVLYMCYIGLTLTAQTDQKNLEKYWKFRTDFVEKYVKIGAEQGESLPAGTIQPLACINNDPPASARFHRV